MWARWVRNRGATKDIRGELDVPVIVGGATINPGDLLVLDADGVTVVPAERAEEVLEASLAREANEADKRAKLEAGALSYELDGLGRESELAHLGPVELFTPAGRREPRVLRRHHGHGDRGPGRAGDLPARVGRLPAVVAEADRVGHERDGRPRPPRLESRGARAPGRRGRGRGLGEGWTDGDLGRGPSYRFRDPDGHRFELYYECERYDPPDHLRPALKNVPGRYTGRGCAIKRLDHVNILAADVRANREFCVDALGYRLYERIELNDGSEAGAWMSASIAAHELIYTRDAHGLNGRLHHLAFWVDTREECLRAADIWLDAGIEIEAAPSKHAIAQGFFLYGIEPGGNRVEVTTGGRFVYAPDEPCVVWTEEERKKGQAWGVKTVESFHTYGTPPA